MKLTNKAKSTISKWSRTRNLKKKMKVKFKRHLKKSRAKTPKSSNRFRRPSKRHRMHKLSTLRMKTWLIKQT